MRHFTKYDLAPLLSLFAVAAFPCVFLFAQNCDEVAAVSMVPFLLVFSITGLVFTGILSLFFRNVSRAAFLSELALLVVINFGLLSDHIQKVFPFLWDRYLFLILALLLLAIFILLLKKKPDMRTPCILVLIAFSSMMLINMIMAIPTMLKKESNPRPEIVPTEITFESEERPNVYYFLFDEYGGYENLLYYYDFDNSEFLTSLEERGFSVARESRNTEAVETITILPNLLNLDYVVKLEDPKNLKNAYVDETFMSRMFMENGYQVQLINHIDALGTTDMKVLTQEQTRRTISEILLNNSLFSRSETARRYLNEWFSLDYSTNYRRCLDNALESGLRSWETAQDEPTLTISYIQCPHSPTMVGPNGEALPFSSGWNWLDHSLYLGQLEFVSKYILELVDTIQEHDPEAVIILQSDHGNRYPIHMWQMKVLEQYDPYEEEPYMKNILNCVYYQGKSFPIEGETGINTLRMVFRDVLGADLPPIEPVHKYFFGYEDEAM